MIKRNEARRRTTSAQFMVHPRAKLRNPGYSCPSYAVIPPSQTIYLPAEP